MRLYVTVKNNEQPYQIHGKPLMINCQQHLGVYNKGIVHVLWYMGFATTLSFS